MTTSGRPGGDRDAAPQPLEPSADHDPGHPLQVILRGAMLGAGGDLALVALRIDEQRLVIQDGIGPLATDMAGNVMRIRDSVAADVLLEGRAVLVPDYPRAGAAAPGVRVQIGSVIVVPLRAGDRVAGALAVGRLTGRPTFDDADLTQLVAFVDRVGVAREIADAHDERRTARLVEDLGRIREDLHDNVIQELFAIGMSLQATARELSETEEREAVLAQVDALDATTRRIRRLITGLPGEDVDVLSLPLSTRLVAIVDSLTPALQCLPTVSFVGPVEASVRPELAAELEAVLREALSNIARHASASSVTVRVAVADGRVSLTVVDDGRGIGTPARTSGLATMRRRATRHRGDLVITTPQGGGTQLSWSVPL